MKTKKVIHLINDEHVNPQIKSAAGCEDYCYVEDRFHCSQYGSDICNKDYSSCDDNAADWCLSGKDTHNCGSFASNGDILN